MDVEEEIRQFSHLGNGEMFAIFGFALLLGHGLCQANAKVGDGGDGELTKLITVKVGAVSRGKLQSSPTARLTAYFSRNQESP